MTTAAPSASSSAAIAWPSPLDPPVTMARRPGQPEIHYASAAVPPRRPAARAVGGLLGRRAAAWASASFSRLCRGGREHVDLEAVAVGRPGPVRHPGRDDGDVALAHDPHVSVEVEGELALQHDDDLLLLVHVPRRVGARLERHEVGHRAAARAPAGTRARAGTPPASGRPRSRTGPAPAARRRASVVKWLWASPSDSVTVSGQASLIFPPVRSGAPRRSGGCPRRSGRRRPGCRPAGSGVVPASPG